MQLQLASGVPKITSPLTFIGKQGTALNYTIVATNNPTGFAAGSLPSGLNINGVTGAIFGTPTVSGTFPVSITASNQWGADVETLTFQLTGGAPRITSSFSASGQQGSSFSYTITASNSPVSFSATGLPAGLDLNSATGVIAGVPIYNGVFAVSITAANQWGADTETLNINLSSDVPVITSPLAVTGVENESNFVYTISATHSPTVFGVAGLPPGLLFDPTTGIISGTLVFGGDQQHRHHRGLTPTASAVTSCSSRSPTRPCRGWRSLTSPVPTHRPTC